MILGTGNAPDSTRKSRFEGQPRHSGQAIRRNVSRIKRLKALSPPKIIPVLGGQYAPDYPYPS